MRTGLVAFLLGIVLALLSAPALAHSGGQSSWDGWQAEFPAGHEIAN